MKSKQINFFITPNDKNKISAFLKANDCLLVKTNVEAAKIDSDISFEKKDVSQIFLSKEDFKKEIFFKQVEDRNYYYVDVVRSLVIEFDIGGFYPYSNKELHRGRFYCITSFYKEQKVVDKDQQFINWMNEIFKLFQKKFLFKKKEYMGYYFSDNALNWVNENNAQLVEGGLKLVAKQQRQR
jgi:hypothetical protein